MSVLKKALFDAFFQANFFSSQLPLKIIIIGVVFHFKNYLAGIQVPLAGHLLGLCLGSMAPSPPSFGALRSSSVGIEHNSWS